MNNNLHYEFGNVKAMHESIALQESNGREFEDGWYVAPVNHHSKSFMIIVFALVLMGAIALTVYNPLGGFTTGGMGEILRDVDLFKFVN